MSTTAAAGIMGRHYNNFYSSRHYNDALDNVSDVDSQLLDDSS